ncbi:hypothetical protein [Endozoicomonas sp. Mp262]|uniref:hypothetical protein n=1 Tax=Endozoicomonas sp. Mp262 TaxID=2919499 RepID=UPI0021D8428D
MPDNTPMVPQGEQESRTTIRTFRIVHQEGGRQVSRKPHRSHTPEGFAKGVFIHHRQTYQPYLGEKRTGRRFSGSVLPNNCHRQFGLEET